mmetsp:Transcript_10503/g.12050  ORF Transcript_10503/g.12050 Transcript_10503/m.12050 type:complete len:328 (-) Transcript_10503:55-1038(-)
MSVQTCLALAPGPVCGLQGRCSTNGVTCICNAGWSQSSEFSFYLDEAPSNATSSFLICDKSDTLLRLFYGIVIVSCVIVGVIHISVVKRWKAFRRLSIYFSYLFFSIVLSTWRLVHIDRNTAEDEITTVLFALTWFFGYATSTVFFNRYIYYMIARSKSLNLDKIPFLLHTQVILMIVDVVVLILFCSSAFVGSYSATKTIVKIYLVAYGMRNIYHFYAARFYIGIIVQDFKHLQHSLAKCADVEYDLDHNIQNLKKLQMVVYSFSVIFAFFYFTPLMWDSMFNLWKYFIPTQMTATCLFTYLVLRYMLKAKMTRPKESTELTTDVA